MVGTDAIYFGALIDWHNYPTGGLNGQSGFTTYAGSALAQFDSNNAKRASLYHISGTPSKWGNGTATSGTPNTNPFSALQGALNAAHAQGTLPYVDWSPWDWALPTNNFAFRPAAIASGNWDTYITQWMTDAKAWGKDILIRPMWEQNTSGQFPWQHGNGGTWTIPSGNNWGGTWTNSIADFKNAWAKIRSIHDSVGATNIKMAWCPNRHGTGETATTFALIAPPMSQLDWLGMDNYPDYGQTLGNAFQGTGAETYLSNNYADLCALDPAKPILIGETGFRGTNGSTVNVSSITTNGTTWTIVVSGQPGTDTFSAGGNSIALSGMTPSAYNGDFTIASVSGTTITVNNTSQPGAVTLLGHASFVNRVGRASLITTSYETDLPSMPRIRGIVPYWVLDGWPDPNTLPLDADGTHTTAVDFLAWKTAIGNAHYLAGQQMATDTSSKLWVPFNDQAVTPDTSTGRPTAQERYLDVLRSVSGLEVLLPMTEASGSTTLSDVSGKGRNATITGNIGIGSSGSGVPALPAWSSPLFTGVAGTMASIPDNDAFSINTTGKFGLVVPFFIPAGALPGAGSFVSKHAASNVEWSLWFGNAPDTLFFNIYQAGGSTYADWSTVMPTTGVWHLMVIAIDLSLTNPIVPYLDGNFVSASSTATGAYTNGTAAVTIGAHTDGTWQMLSGQRLGPVALYSTKPSAESAAEIFAAWQPAPVISAVSPGTPTGTGTTPTWTTDIGGSTWLEYGPTTAYGTVTPLQPLRVTSHSVTLTGLTPGTIYHYRAHSRNAAGTEAVSTDSTFTTTGGSTTATLFWVTVV